MNYKALKWVIDWILNSHKCPSCNSLINESWVDIIWAAWSTVNIDISCTTCWKHSIIKAEVAQVDVNSLGNWKKIDPQILKDQILSKINLSKNTNNLSKEDLDDLNNKISNENISISDLFTD